MTRRIFRESALRRHHDRLERVELPRYARLPWAALWLALGLLLAVAGALLWAVQIPVYAGGPGVVVTMPADAGRPDGLVVAALLSAEHAARLEPAQTARIEALWHRESTREDAQTGAVIAVEPELLSPAAARTRYAVSGEALSAGPVTVAYVALDGAAGSWEAPPELLLGSRVEVRVKIGTQSGLALLPGVGQWLDSGAIAQ
jgi:hypothetical protein